MARYGTVTLNQWSGSACTFCVQNTSVQDQQKCALLWSENKKIMILNSFFVAPVSSNGTTDGVPHPCAVVLAVSCLSFTCGRYGGMTCLWLNFSQSIPSKNGCCFNCYGTNASTVGSVTKRRRGLTVFALGSLGIEVQLVRPLAGLVYCISTCWGRVKG